MANKVPVARFETAELKTAVRQTEKKSINVDELK